MSVSVYYAEQKVKNSKKNTNWTAVIPPHGTQPNWTLTCSTWTLPWLYYTEDTRSPSSSWLVCWPPGLHSFSPSQLVPLKTAASTSYFFLPTAVNANLLQSDRCRNLSWWLLYCRNSSELFLLALQLYVHPSCSVYFGNFQRKESI